ncbi:response regulator [Nubsella zeaxanthinifaciens]|jgi:DNA-binding NtrC family response regulator|uniref:response regulator n=1 Tax=Nubsella zeaxanthinifaciens TaxID=392412 RepID=UPI000DE42F29|nr:response regulator [Nubsella zeaxanthinifaciens]
MDKIKVLLVEDDMAIGLHIRNFLTKNSCEVYLAQDGEEAIEKYLKQQDKFDAIVTDILMPKLNGLELLMYVRNEGLKDMRIIGMTSGFSSYLSSLSSEKFDFLLNKPIDLDYLLQLVRKEE